ncbi:aspartate/glutamate racemase family protein [Paracoccus denitrificans]|nr:aspartate/glutamate racemase family protein [Paracoccus denitrificans]UPV96426.1 aspartate/glutamate racemase family protein [Paracoccus denitrificans]WQO34868.1 aspartate/glutamate racemase family protein [Paracoccus denitrificans]
MAIAQRLVDRGADCLILGCTEVGMLLDQGDVPVPVFDITQVHCEAAFAAALNA